MLADAAEVLDAERAEGRTYLAMAESGRGTLETHLAAEAVGLHESKASVDSMGAQTVFEVAVLLVRERNLDTGRGGGTAAGGGSLVRGAKSEERESLSRNMVGGGWGRLAAKGE